MSDEPTPAKRPRFTIRMMMLLVMVAGGLLGWITHRARVQREAVAAIVRAGGNVVYDYQWPVFETKPRGPAWLREWIGRDYFDTVYGINANKPAVDDAVVAKIGGLTEVRFLGLQGSSVTDDGLAKLAGLHKLRVLHLRAPNVNGSGFRHLSGLRDLRALNFNQTPITDENLTYLLPLTSIESLGFYKTRISDAGMKKVARLSRLKKIWLQSSDVGDEGLRELARTGRSIQVILRPNTRITPEGINTMKTLAPEMTITP